MFYIETADGRAFHGRDLHWDQVPVDVVIVSMTLHLMTPMGSVIANQELRGFDAFGFQRYDHVLDDGRLHTGGCQILAKKSGTVVVVDVEFSTGRCHISAVDESACGYNPALWRVGCSTP